LLTVFLMFAHACHLQYLNFSTNWHVNSSGYFVVIYFRLVMKYVGDIRFNRFSFSGLHSTDSLYGTLLLNIALWPHLHCTALHCF